jgi:hypothetical protein
MARLQPHLHRVLVQAPEIRHLLAGLKHQRAGQSPALFLFARSKRSAFAQAANWRFCPKATVVNLTIYRCLIFTVQHGHSHCPVEALAFGFNPG